MKQPPLQVQVRSLGHVQVRESDFLKFDHEQRKGEDFSGRKLKGFSSHGCKFESCRFEKMRIESGGFGSGRVVSEYIDCSFDGSRISKMAGGYARFVRCSFRNVDLRDWFCFAVEMIDCTFSGKMKGCVFNGTPRAEEQAVVRRKHNEFHGNDFSGLRLDGVSFRTGIDLSKQTLPTAPDYLYVPDAEAAVRQVRAEVITWRDLGMREQAMATIRALEFELEGGQQQLLLGAEKSLDKGDQAVRELLNAYAQSSAH